MCTVSMIGDHYSDKFKQNPIINPIITTPATGTYTFPIYASAQEVADLKKEVLEMKELLKKALEYDKKNNEPHCEMEDKVKLLKEVAKMVGVDLEEIFKK